MMSKKRKQSPSGLVLILYGGPGSGKSTQAEILTRKLKAPQLNMGEALRQLTQKRTPSARELREILARGKLAPLAVSREIVKDFFRQHYSEPLLVIDGYPRSIPQAQTLSSLARKYRKRVLFVFLDLPIRVAVDRLVKRAREEGRADDQPKAIAERLRIFKREAKKLFAFFGGQERVRVSGQGSVDEVNKRLESLLKKTGRL